MLIVVLLASSSRIWSESGAKPLSIYPVCLFVCYLSQYYIILMFMKMQTQGHSRHHKIRGEFQDFYHY